MLQYEIYSPAPSNKTAQRNSQHCTELYNEVNNYDEVGLCSKYNTRT